MTRKITDKNMQNILFDLDGVLKDTYENDLFYSLNFPLIELIKRIKESSNASIYIATNSSLESARTFLANAQILHLFSGFFCPDTTGSMKSNKKFYEQANFLLGYPQNPPIFFDDSQTNISMALQSGWYSYIYTGTESLLKNDYISTIIKQKFNP